MAQIQPRRDAILVLAEAVDSEVRESASSPRLRQLSSELLAVAEQEACRLKAIADLANHGALTRATRRWQEQLAETGTLTECAATHSGAS